MVYKINVSFNRTKNKNVFKILYGIIKWDLEVFQGTKRLLSIFDIMLTRKECFAKCVWLTIGKSRPGKN